MSPPSGQGAPCLPSVCGGGGAKVRCPPCGGKLEVSCHLSAPPTEVHVLLLDDLLLLLQRQDDRLLLKSHSRALTSTPDGKTMLRPVLRLTSAMTREVATGELGGSSELCAHGVGRGSCQGLRYRNGQTLWRRPPSKRLRQEGLEVEVSLGYKGQPCVKTLKVELSLVVGHGL